MTEYTPGRILHYRLTWADAEAVNRRIRDAEAHMHEHQAAANGVQVHVGSTAVTGDIVPMVAVKWWQNEYGRDAMLDGQPVLSSWGVNGQAFLDGNHTLWLTSVPNVAAPGGWTWPE